MTTRRGPTPWRFSKYAKESHGGAPIPPRLHQDVENVAVLVHRAPHILLATVEGDEHFIEIPGVSEAPVPLPKLYCICTSVNQSGQSYWPLLFCLNTQVVLAEQALQHLQSEQQQQW